MEQIQRYNIVYTETAVLDMEEKADYIAYELRDTFLAETWYLRLRDAIQQDLSTFPFKYGVYTRAPWNENGIRLMLFLNDVILYSVDEHKSTVYIRAVCTKGRDLAAHLEQAGNT